MGCQDLGSDFAQVTAAAGKVGVVDQMRKQREERVECNLNCRLLGGELDASTYPLTFPYFCVGSRSSVCSMSCGISLLGVLQML